VDRTKPIEGHDHFTGDFGLLVDFEGDAPLRNVASVHTVRDGADAQYPHPIEFDPGQPPLPTAVEPCLPGEHFLNVNRFVKLDPNIPITYPSDRARDLSIDTEFDGDAVPHAEARMRINPDAAGRDVTDQAELPAAVDYQYADSINR
jgi:hypothetical protein